MAQSEQLNELFSALSKAQAEMEIAGLTSNNPFFKSKYADLAELIKASRPALTNNGLSIIQIPESHEGIKYIRTVLGHSSGQWIDGLVEVITTKQDIQSLGSAITYMCRYSYRAMSGVIVSDDDDDGEAAVYRKEDKPIQPKPEDKPIKQIKPIADPVINEDQLNQLKHEIDEDMIVHDYIIKALNIKYLTQIPQSRFAGILAYAQKEKAK
jgi:hypothetical protein